MSKVQQLEINMDFKIHNRFDVFRKDIRTGKEEQIAYAENILLDRLWTRGAWGSSIGYWEQSGGFAYVLKHTIAVGSGTGILSAARTTLFSEIFSALGLNHQTAVGANYLKSTMSITRTELQDNGQTYREIGCKAKNAYSDDGLVSHALLLDMNGNPITIAKTDTDIITFYASWYFYIPVTSWYDGSVKLRSIQHALFWQIIRSGVHGPLSGVNLNYRNGLRRGPTIVNSGPTYEFNSAPATCVWTAAQKKMTFYKRLAVGDLNGVGTLKGIASIDYSYLEFKRNLPIDPVPQTNPWMPESDVVGEALTSGNGIITDFVTTFPFIHDVTVKKDGVAENPANYTVYQNIPNYIYCDPWFVYDYDKALYYNPWYETIGISSVRLNNSMHVDASQDGITWVEVARYTQNYSGEVVRSILAAYRKYKYWRSFNDSAYMPAAYQFTFDTADITNYNNIRFSSPPGLVTGEAVGTGDGSNLEFTLDHAPIADSLTMYVDGVVNANWTLNGSIVTFTAENAPGNGLAVTADYRYSCVMTVDYTTPVIPKDVNHVFDLTFSMTFGEYTPT